MSKKANPTSIGLFIVIGLALGVVCLLLLGSTRLFSRTHECVLYFNDSLNGLNEGAPVKYRGVTIGSVERVMVRFNQAPDDYAMPVIIELEERLLKQHLGDRVEVFSENAIEDHVKHGLRASLQSESLVTGVLYVEMRPDRAAAVPVFHQLAKLYPEIPTEATQIQQLFNNLASLDIKRVETNLNSLLTKLDSSVDRLNVGEINAAITNVLISINRLVSSPGITSNLAAVNTTLEEYRQLGQKLNRSVDPIAGGISNSLFEASRALVQVQGAAENMRTFVAPDSPLRYNLDQALQQLAGASQSAAALVEFLKQHPNALLVGREPSPSNP